MALRYKRARSTLHHIIHEHSHATNDTHERIPTMCKKVLPLARCPPILLSLRTLSPARLLLSSGQQGARVGRERRQGGGARGGEMLGREPAQLQHSTNSLLTRSPSQLLLSSGKLGARVGRERRQGGTALGVEKWLGREPAQLQQAVNLTRRFCP